MISQAGAWKSLYQDFWEQRFFPKIRSHSFEGKKKKKRKNTGAVISSLQSFTFCCSLLLPALPLPRMWQEGSRGRSWPGTGTGWWHSRTWSQRNPNKTWPKTSAPKHTDTGVPLIPEFWGSAVGSELWEALPAQPDTASPPSQLLSELPSLP